MKTKNIQNKLSAEFIKRNKIFKAANAAEKRILIAKDVIEQINNKTYKASEGSWVNIEKIENNLWNLQDEKFNDFNEKELCDFVDPKNSCRVCALGSLFVSGVRFNDNFKVKDYDDGAFDYTDIYFGQRKDKTGIVKFFGTKQLRLIEIAFELGDGLHRDFWTGDENFGESKEGKALDFGYKYKNPTNRLLAIMNNIASNPKGLFTPI